MNQDRKDFLNLGNLPARLNVTEAAWFLGFADNDLPVLISAGLLKPLGRPAASGSKYFASAALLKLRDNPSWLAKASNATVRHWKQKNANRTKRPSELCQLSSCGQS